MSIYFGDTKVTGTGIQLDSSLSSMSQRPVTNEAITNALVDIGYSEWQKPSDWVDIRSGAMDNSIYLLIGHSADYSTYPQFDFTAKISDGHTYDVYIDGIKMFTTASEATTSINWQTLALTSGRTTTHPTNLVTHIVCITPTSYSDTFLEVKEVLGSYQDKGLLWAHFEVDYAFTNQICSSGAAAYRNLILDVVTAKNDELKFSGSAATLFWNCTNLKQVPKLDLSQATKSNYYSLRNAQNLKKLRISAGVITVGDALFQNASSLTELPPLNFNTANINISNFLSGVTELKDTTLNFSRTPTKKLTFGGTSSNRIDGLKGLTVNSSAPFDNATAPQLDVKYTGLDRAALVNLFKSMPYNVGYTVVGSPTITDGVASGFSSSDRVYANNSITATGDFEYNIKFSTGASIDNPGWIFGSSVVIEGGTSYWCGAYIATNAINVAVTRANGTNYGCPLNQLTFSTNETYVLNVKRVSGEVTSSLYNSADTLIKSATATIPGDVIFSANNFGGNPANFGGNFTGSVDLNNTYININGIPWFTGKAAMTKTCSVVGCTGTADLTQADKDIALDKGWSLTVA